jgi:anti-anti-sigma factor
MCICLRKGSGNAAAAAGAPAAGLPVSRDNGWCGVSQHRATTQGKPGIACRAARLCLGLSVLAVLGGGTWPARRRLLFLALRAARDLRQGGETGGHPVTDLRISVTVLPAGDGACSVISLAGEADLTTTELRDALAAEVAVGKPRLLLIDMTALSFIDSAAMQMIIGTYRVFRRDGGTLALVSPAPAVARTLELAGTSDIIAVYATINEAITSAPSWLI